MALVMESILLSKLKDKNKVSRRKTLQLIKEELEKSSSNLIQKLNNGNETLPSKEEEKELLSELGNILVTLLSDESELNRTINSEILCEMTQKIYLSENHFIIIFSTLAQRLGNTPIIEESEEVRSLNVKLISHIVDVIDEKKLPQYYNDLINILKATVLDPCPEVRVLANKCICQSALKSKDKFNLQSSSLIKPLVKCISHQRFKIRIAALEALGKCKI